MSGKEIFLLGGRSFWRGRLFAFCADEGGDLKLRDGGGRDPDALGVGANVGRGEKEPLAGNEAEVVGGESLDSVSVGEAEPDEQALGAGASGKGLANQALRVGGLAGIEVANVANPLEVGGWKLDGFAVESQKFYRALLEKAGWRQVSGDPFLGEAAGDGFFAAAGHGLKLGLLHGRRRNAAKFVQSGGKKSILMLQLSFVNALSGCNLLFYCNLEA